MEVGVVLGPGPEELGKVTRDGALMGQERHQEHHQEKKDTEREV